MEFDISKNGIAIAKNISDISDINSMGGAYPAADRTKVGFITVTQDVDLDAMETGIATNATAISTNIGNISTNIGNISTNTTAIALNTAKVTYPVADSTKVGFITVTQDVDLDTMESGIATNATAIALNTAKVTYPVADSTKVGFIAVTQDVDLDTMETGIATNSTSISTNATAISTNITDIATNTTAIALNTVKNSYPTADATKVGFITVTGDVNLDNIGNNYPAVDSTKVGFITITQPVDLDTIESDTTANNAKVSSPTWVPTDDPGYITSAVAGSVPTIIFIKRDDRRLLGKTFTNTETFDAYDLIENQGYIPIRVNQGNSIHVINNKIVWRTT